MRLFKYDYPTGHDGAVKSFDLYVWAAVNINTGEVELDHTGAFDDELSELTSGWKWQKFRLTPITSEGEQDE